VAEAVLCAVKEISRLPEGRDALKSAGKSAIFGACLTVGSSSPQGAGPVVYSRLLYILHTVQVYLFIYLSKCTELSIILRSMLIELCSTVTPLTGATSILAEAVEQQWLHGEHSNTQATKIRHWLTVR